MVDEPPLGRETTYPDTYSPDLLFPIERSDAREPLGISAPLPFAGVDIWNAWELTWLGPSGQPAVAALEIRVPADSPRLIESKSLKLYLNSFAMTRESSADAVAETIGRDLSEAAGASVQVRIVPEGTTDAMRIVSLPGKSLDEFNVACGTWTVEPEFLTTRKGEPVEAAVHSHALRSLCPVTKQPDTGSIMIGYAGDEIDPAGLLRYIASFRCHEDFHEGCVERMYLDIMARCKPDRLAVYARYQRRGGIDINPYRSSYGGAPENLRLWRQ